MIMDKEKFPYPLKLVLKKLNLEFFKKIKPIEIVIPLY